MSPGLLRAPEASLYERLEQLRDVAENKHKRGLLLHVGAFEGAYAQVRELSRSLSRIRKAGKPVHCYFDSADNAGYELLASGCDRISMPPSGTLDLAGVRAQTFFARDLLSNLGVRAELLQVGRFKGAADMFTESAMPDTTRATLSTITQTLQADLVATIAKGRHRSQALVQAAIDEGPLTAAAALRHGLVDDLAYADEAKEHLRVAAKVKAVEHEDKETEVGVGDVFEALLSRSERPPNKPYVVLVPVVGSITSGSHPLADGASADTFIAEMKRIADDDNAAALVLRIDSPGGSALASDLMWHAVNEVRKKKPVFASVGGMAASGGYYIASAAQRIFAEPTSLLGSIGVVGGKIAFADLAERIGIHTETLRASPNAGWADPTTTFSDSERAALQKLLDSTYDLFLRRVALGRGVQVAAIEPVAEGRLLHGIAAQRGGLVDEMGGLLDTLQAARIAANLPRDSKVLLWPPRRSALDALLSHGLDVKAVTLLHSSPWTETAVQRFPMLQVLAGSDRVAAALPYGLDLR